MFNVSGQEILIMDDYKEDIRESVTDAVEKANVFLKPYGLSVRLGDCQEEDAPSEDCLGYYEGGSVFESGTIMVNVLAGRLFDAFLDCYGGEELVSDMPGLRDEAAVTVFHEVGHGLMEHILDYADNIEEISDWVGSPEAEPFFDVFNDDNRSEEDVVEEFARNLYEGVPSVLSKCIAAMAERSWA